MELELLHVCVGPSTPSTSTCIPSHLHTQTHTDARPHGCVLHVQTQVLERGSIVYRNAAGIFLRALRFDKSWNVQPETHKVEHLWQ